MAQGMDMTVGERLAQRLGHAPDTRYLIINCDDVGSSHSANVAALKAMDKGIATSATLMVPCPWAREAATMFKGRDMGVHLTLTAEYPGYRWRSLTGARSLHDRDGFLPARIKHAVQNAAPADVRAECQAQIDQALAWGVDVTHLDAHMGVANIAPFAEIFLDLAKAYGLPVRLLDGGDSQFNFDIGTNTSRTVAENRGILASDRFIFQWPVDTRDFLAEHIPKLKPGITEFYAHPVADGPELRAYDPEAPDLRAKDAIYLCDPELKGLIAKSGAKPISFRPLRDLQRSGS
jgi:chitin disaccharide deacetylase